MSVRYSQEVHTYIREHLGDFTQEEMAEQCNKLFGTSFSVGSMKSYYANHKLKAGKRKAIRSKLWPEEVVEVLLANYKGRTYAETLELLERETGRKYTQAQLKSYYANHKLNSGMTGRFEKGHEPWTKGKRWDDYMSPEAQEDSRKTCFEHAHIPDNAVPVGTIRETKDGYLIKKVDERGYQWDRWKLLHRLVWEENFGPVPEGMIVGFKDTDKTNCSPDNLYLLTLGENAVMNHKGYRSQDPQLTEVGLATVRLQQAIKKRKKEHKNGSVKTRRQSGTRSQERSGAMDL